MTDKMRRRIVQGIALSSLAPALVARAQDRPIRILVGFPPGGAIDGVARMLADKLPSELKQPVIVENRAGAGGRLAADALLQSTDGTTYMVAPDATVIFGTLIYQQQNRWNLERDFANVGTLTTAPMGLTINADIGAKNVKEFVEWLRKNPGKANVGVPGTGGRAHFLSYALGKAIGVDLNVIPYKGTAGIVTDLVGGQLSAAVSLVDAMIPHEKTGKVRVIGLLVPQRSPLNPDIPTLAEQGVNVVAGETWAGMWANAKAPAAETEKVRNAVKKTLADPAVIKTLANNYSSVSRFRSGEEMRELEKSELAYWGSVVKASGFKATD